VSDKHTLIAFISTLVAIVVLVLAGAYVATLGKSTEALGIGAAVTGLIGVIGTFKPRTSQTEVTNTSATNPTEDATTTTTTTE
jgi:hypothetical protein